MKNILDICKDVADIASTQRPTDLFSEDEHNSIFLSVTKSALDSLMRYGDWQDLTKEASMRISCNKTVYPINNIVTDFYCILNNTIYVKDENKKVIGAITPEQWQRDKYFGLSDIDIKFKIQNNAIKFITPPQAGCYVVFQYRSNAICTDSVTFEEKPEITKNTDIPIFDEYLVKLSILWRWLKRNGMDYTEEYNEYQEELKKKFATGLATKDIVLAGGDIDLLNSLGGVIINAKTSE